MVGKIAPATFQISLPDRAIERFGVLTTGGIYTTVIFTLNISLNALND